MQNKSKNRASGQGPAIATDAGSGTASDWDSIEADFFAREADLYRASPVENFDDLDNG